MVDGVRGDREVPGNGEALEYFYCNQGGPRFSEPEAIVRSLARQVLCKFPGSGFRMSSIPAFVKGTTKDSFGDGLRLE